MIIRYGEHPVFTQDGELISTSYTKETYDENGNIISIEQIDSIPTEG